MQEECEFVKLNRSEVTPLHLREIDILLRCVGSGITDVIQLLDVKTTDEHIILTFKVVHQCTNGSNILCVLSASNLLSNVSNTLQKLHAIGICYNNLYLNNLLVSKDNNVIMNNFSQATLLPTSDLCNKYDDWIDLRRLFVSLYGEANLNELNHSNHCTSNNKHYVSIDDLMTASVVSNMKKSSNTSLKGITNKVKNSKMASNGVGARETCNPAAISDLRKTIKYLEVGQATIHNLIYNFCLIDCVLRYPCRITSDELLSLSRLISTITGNCIYRDTQHDYLSVAHKLQFCLFNIQLLPVFQKVITLLSTDTVDKAKEKDKDKEKVAADSKLSAMFCKLVKVLECEPYLFFSSVSQWLCIIS